MNERATAHRGAPTPATPTTRVAVFGQPGTVSPAMFRKAALTERAKMALDQQTPSLDNDTDDPDAIGQGESAAAADNKTPDDDSKDAKGKGDKKKPGDDADDSKSEKKPPPDVQRDDDDSGDAGGGGGSGPVWIPDGDPVPPGLAPSKGPQGQDHDVKDKTLPAHVTKDDPSLELIGG